jgi:sugar phosphate isomerase/epimerase
MWTRREFGKLTTLAIAGAAIGKLFAASNKRPVGVQLYTIRQQAEKDLPGVLKAIHKIGYQEVEPYWNIYNHPAKELRTMIADQGLSAPSGHFDYAGLETKFDYAQELGVHYMICPMLPEAMWNSLDDYKKAADQFNKWGAEARKRGMRFGFHNHNYEFKDLVNHNGYDPQLDVPKLTGYDVLLRFTDHKLVMFEMDCYWITQAGLDPVKMMNEHSNRIRLLHLKDRKPGFPISQWKDKAAEHFTEVGSGTIDWKAVLAAAKKNKIEHMYVENDEPEIPAIKSLRRSYEYLEKLG